MKPKQLAILEMASLLFGKMTHLKTLQLRPLHCKGKLANSIHWVISHVRLTDNPLLQLFSSENAAPLSPHFILLYRVQGPYILTVYAVVCDTVHILTF